MSITADDRALLVDAFLVEADEMLSRLEELLLNLERSPDNEEILQEIFRAAHTLKGNAACLQFDGLTEFAHVVEELLEQLREGATHATPACITTLLDAVDALRDLCGRAVLGDGSLTGAQRALMDELRRWVDRRSLAIDSTKSGAASGSAITTRSSGTLRVGIEKLDRMLDLTSEIAIARGHVRQVIDDGDRDRLVDAMRELDRLSLDLQELVMSARLVLLAPALRPYHRIVRDVSSACSKRVALAIEGGDVEVDTTVIELLKDPITHMIRNAIDHGIEPADERARRGKPAIGTIRIAAAHEGSGIAIRFSDDGAGLDEAHIVQRARTLGLDPDRLTRQETLNLVLEPGFTTVEQVTDLSGRGVGMDVVHRNVEALRGTLSIASEPGVGTTITIRLPLTLAVIEGFGVRVGDQTYVIPIDAIVECREMPSDAGNGPRGVLSVRGDALPFIRVRNLFGLDTTPSVRENIVIVHHELGRAGIVVDELLGGNQTVMKPLGGLLRHVPGVAGSSVLGNGRVALVLDTHEIVRRAAEEHATHQSINE